MLEMDAIGVEHEMGEGDTLLVETLLHDDRYHHQET